MKLLDFEAQIRESLAAGYNPFPDFERFKKLRVEVQAALRKYPERLPKGAIANYTSVASSNEAKFFFDELLKGQMLRGGAISKFAIALAALEQTDPAQHITTFRQWMAHYNFWANGQKVFMIEPDLSRMLADTDVRVPRQFVRLPFPCIYMSWRGLDLGISFSKDDTQFPIEGCYVYTVTESDWDGEVREIMRLFFVSETIESGGGNALFTTISLGNDPAKIIDADTFIEGMEHRPNLAKMQDIYEKSGAEPEREMDRYVNEMIPLTKLAINTILYINSAGADLRECLPQQAINLEREIAALAGKPKRRKKRDRLQRQLDKTSKLAYVRVGASVKAPAGMTAVMDRERGIRRMGYRFSVRGHWRHPWMCVENMSEEEFAAADKSHEKLSPTGKKMLGVLRWVEPFEKGPDMAAKLQQQYVVPLRESDG